MNCPHCSKYIEDRWAYQVGQKLFRRGLHNSFCNVTVIKHILSTNGFPVYLVEEEYSLHYKDMPKTITYVAVPYELDACMPVTEKYAVVPASRIINDKTNNKNSK